MIGRVIGALMPGTATRTEYQPGNTNGPTTLPRPPPPPPSPAAGKPTGTAAGGPPRPPPPPPPPRPPPVGTFPESTGGFRRRSHTTRFTPFAVGPFSVRTTLPELSDTVTSAGPLAASRRLY